MFDFLTESFFSITSLKNTPRENLATIKNVWLTSPEASRDILKVPQTSKYTSENLLKVPEASTS